MPKKSKVNKLARMSDEERARYLQHRADVEEEARRRKHELVARFIKVHSQNLKFLIKQKKTLYTNPSLQKINPLVLKRTSKRNSSNVLDAITLYYSLDVSPPIK